MKRLLVATAVVMLTLTGAAFAQAPSPIKRTPLQKFDVPGTNYETVIALAEIAPNAAIGRHTHPGIEGGYLVEGELTFMLESQPPKAMKVGDSWQVPVGAIHDAKAGPAGCKIVVTYVVEKGKPLASPAQ